MSLPQPLTVQQLVSQAAAGDTKAFEELYNQYYGLLYSVAFIHCKDSQLSQDIVQQVFIKAWQRIGELAEMENPVGWLRNTAKFQIIKTLQQQFSDRRNSERWWQLQQREADDVNWIISRKQQAELMQSIVSLLPGRQREIFKLVREEGISYAEIAERLQIGKETVKEHMARALKNIRESILKHKDYLLTVWVYLANIFL